MSPARCRTGRTPGSGSRRSPNSSPAITVDQLLTHTAGLFDYTNVDPAQANRYFAEFGATPTQKDGQFLQDRIFDPLHMSDTGYQPDASPTGHDAIEQYGYGIQTRDVGADITHFHDGGIAGRNLAAMMAE